ncbi:hypothetical protein ABIB42_003767 [Massilia sp. UYP32]
MRQPLTGFVVGVMMCVASVCAQERMGTFDPGKLKGPAKGVPSEVIVLGTPRLPHLQDAFKPSSLKILNERLLGWKPHIIAIEALSGTQCAFMRQHPQRYAQSVERYCPWDPAPARAATGFDVASATAEIERLLANWPSTPTPSQRRHLASMFLAGGEPVSALVQWLRLPEAERRTGEGLDTTLVASLTKQRGRRQERGEDTMIASPLAAALGLERVHSMDDHTADSPASDPKAFDYALRKAWNNPATAKYIQMVERFYAGVGEPEGIMRLYRHLNDLTLSKLIYDSEFGAALAEDSPRQYGCDYVAYWETRNLRMAANIGEAIGHQPGSRTLVIVGASQKPYLEAYLDNMLDIRVLSSDQVLR